MKVAIAGGGVLGQYLTTALIADGHSVLLMEQDDRVIERLPVALREGATVARVDACEVRSLRRLHLEDVDVVVAATGDDEDNLVVSLLAKQEFAVPRVLARLNNPKNEHLFNESWGVDVVLSIPQMIGAMVEEEVTRGRVVRLLQLRNQARLVEVILDDDAPVVGCSIAELSLPRQFTFVAIIRDGQVVIPRGDTSFHPGDEVLALVTPESEEDARRLLTES
jgi:trk system potassium uptake protein TrkA